jgi:hypothetical protein
MWRLYGELLVLLVTCFGLGCVVGLGVVRLVVRRSAATARTRGLG